MLLYKEGDYIADRRTGRSVGSRSLEMGASRERCKGMAACSTDPKYPSLQSHVMSQVQVVQTTMLGTGERSVALILQFRLPEALFLEAVIGRLSSCERTCTVCCLFQCRPRTRLKTTCRILLHYDPGTSLSIGTNVDYRNCALGSRLKFLDMSDAWWALLKGRVTACIQSCLNSSVESRRVSR